MNNQETIKNESEDMGQQNNENKFQNIQNSSQNNISYLPIMKKNISQKQLQRRSNQAVRLLSQPNIVEDQQQRIQNSDINQEDDDQEQQNNGDGIIINKQKASISSSQSSSSSLAHQSSNSSLSIYNENQSPSPEENQQSIQYNNKSSMIISNMNDSIRHNQHSSIELNINGQRMDIIQSQEIYGSLIQNQKFSKSCQEIQYDLRDLSYKISLDYNHKQIREIQEEQEDKDSINLYKPDYISIPNSIELKQDLKKVSEISESTPRDSSDFQYSFNSQFANQNPKKLMTLLPNAYEGDEMTLDMLIGEIDKKKQEGQGSESYNNSMREIPLNCEDINKQQTRNDNKRQGFNDMFYFSENIQILENIIKLENHKMANQVRQKIVQAIKGHFAFSNLEDQHVNHVVEKMFACTALPGEYIFQQNDEGSLFFFIEQGNVCIQINKEFKKCLDEYNSFGELALLYNSPRSASAQAGQSGIDLILWAIDRVTFLNIIKHLNQQDLSVNRNFLENVSFFSNFTHEQKDLLASQFTYQKFHKGEIIVNIGDDANSFYIIKTGQVSIVNSNQEDERHLQSGDWFGESSLYLNKSIRTRTVKAKSFEVVLLALSRKATQEILGDRIQYLAFRNIMRWAFEKDKILSRLIAMQREKLFSHLNIRKVQIGEEVINTQRPNQICVILEGSLVQKARQIRYEKAQVVGSKCLIMRTFSEEYITVSEKESLIAEISKEQLEQLLGSSYDHLVTRNRKSHENSVYFSKGSEKKVVDDEDLMGLQNIRLMDFIFIKELGRGNFGSVNLIFNNCSHDQNIQKKLRTEHLIPNQTKKSRYIQNPENHHQQKIISSKQKEKLFAIKVFINNYIFQRGIEKYMLREKSTLQKCNFPFIMRYYRSFYDNYHIYFMNEFINGMDFFTVMREIGLLNKQQAQFYTAFIILTLQYLNNQGFVYRDLKPENILIDHEGWPKLVDMGTAKNLYDQNKQLTRTYSLVGTPHYMAPEVIQQKGYGFSVDLYSLGVILYELLVGYLPYGEDVDDPIQVYQLVIEGRLGFPNHMKNRLSDKKLISQLMAKSPEVRLGGSYGALKSHEWFEDFDWDVFFNKQITPPYIPPEEMISTESKINQLLQNNSKNSFQTIMMIQSAQSGRYEKDFKSTSKQVEFLKNFAY